MALQRIIQRRFVTFSGWPHCIGIGGQLASEWVTTLDRNQWPHCIGIGTEMSNTQYGQTPTGKNAPRKTK
jgi:hypothetical protein